MASDEVARDMSSCGLKAKISLTNCCISSLHRYWIMFVVSKSVLEERIDQCPTQPYGQRFENAEHKVQSLAVRLIYV